MLTPLLIVESVTHTHTHKQTADAPSEAENGFQKVLETSLLSEGPSNICCHLLLLVVCVLYTYTHYHVWTQGEVTHWGQTDTDQLWLQHTQAKVLFFRLYFGVCMIFFFLIYFLFRTVVILSREPRKPQKLWFGHVTQQHADQRSHPPCNSCSPVKNLGSPQIFRRTENVTSEPHESHTVEQEGLSQCRGWSAAVHRSLTLCGNWIESRGWKPISVHTNRRSIHFSLFTKRQNWLNKKHKSPNEGHLLVVSGQVADPQRPESQAPWQHPVTCYGSHLLIQFQQNTDEANTGRFAAGECSDQKTIGAASQTHSIMRSDTRGLIFLTDY